MATRVSVPRYRRPRKLKTAWTVEIVIYRFGQIPSNPEFPNQSLVLPGKRQKREEISNNIKCSK